MRENKNKLKFFYNLLAKFYKMNAWNDDIIKYFKKLRIIVKKNQNGYIEIFLAFLVAIVILLIIFSIDNKSFKGEKYEAIAAKVIEKKYSEATVTNTRLVS